MKIIDKTKLNEKLKKKVSQEISALKVLEKHPNVVQLIDVIENDTRICLVLEYCSGGELFDLITKYEKVSYN